MVVLFDSVFPPILWCGVLLCGRWHSELEVLMLQVHLEIGGLQLGKA